MKTYAQWNGSGLDLSKFLQVGDEVDEMMVEYFRDVLPPATHRSNLIQIGEPYSSVDDRETFSTIRQENGRWYYAGHCHRGDSIEPRPVNERLFIGVFPAALSYADRKREENNDYKRLAILPYSTLELEIEKDCPAELAEEIKQHAATIQAKRGQHFQISSCGQTVILGSALK